MTVMLLITILLPVAAWAWSAAHQTVQANEEGPVDKVVRLLSEMKEQVQKEAEDDELAYNKYMCWCTTNREEKKLAIENAEQQIAELTTFLNESGGKEAQLKTEIEGITADIAEAQEALLSAVTLRAEEKQKFKEQEVDMKETCMLLDQAVEVMSKVQLVQKPAPSVVKKAAAALVQVQDIVRQRLPSYRSVMQQDLFDVMGSLQEFVQEKVASPQAQLADKLLRSVGVVETRASPVFSQSMLLPWEKTDEQIGQKKKSNDLMGAASGAKSYNARSSSILGILSEMHGEFSRDLAKAMYDEYNALVSFQKLSSAKTSEIYVASTTKARKEKALADLLDAVAKAKEDKAALEEAKAADENFLVELERSCKEEDEEYHKRLEIRTEEIRALAEALQIISADEARATFSRSQLSFIQKSATDTGRSELEAQDRAAERAMQRIAKVAQKNANWALASLAVRVRLDSFTKVIEAMDMMMASLRAQQKEEYEKWEFCKTAIDKTEDEIKTKTQVKKDLNEKHMSLSDKTETLSKGIDTLKQQVKDNEISLKDAGEDRKAENELYQQSVMDQRAAINILNKALARLKEFYAVALAQTKQEPLPEPGAATPPPPAKGKAYEKSVGASGALQLIAQVINDATRAEKELDVTEQAAQQRYATLVRDLTSSIEADRNVVEEKASQQAATEVEKSETEEAQLANNQELENLEQLLKSHHLDCDFLIKYFDVRQQARQEEIDAITDAKAILSGADFGKK